MDKELFTRIEYCLKYVALPNVAKDTIEVCKAALSQAEPLPARGVELYAIPDTHRVVSVELLRDVLSYCPANQLSQEVRAIELRAIIGNKEPHNE